MLRNHFNVSADRGLLEESCIPSYCHPNLAIAGVAWWRLWIAGKLAAEHATGSRVLDFGASVGELRHFLPRGTDYHFIESDDRLAEELRILVPEGKRTRLSQIEYGSFDVIFALDSLEHNSNRAAIVKSLKKGLAAQGIFIVSGPTENYFYRLGRKIAGFRGGYHEADVYDIEQEVALMFDQRSLVVGPFGLPLFRIALWK